MKCHTHTNIHAKRIKSKKRKDIARKKERRRTQATLQRFNLNILRFYCCHYYCCCVWMNGSRTSFLLGRRMENFSKCLLDFVFRKCFQFSAKTVAANKWLHLLAFCYRKTDKLFETITRITCLRPHVPGYLFGLILNKTFYVLGSKNWFISYKYCVKPTEILHNSIKLNSIAHQLIALILFATAENDRVKVKTSKF